MSIEVRRIEAGEFEAWDALITTTFGYDPRAEDLEFFRNRNELDRAFAAPSPNSKILQQLEAGEITVDEALERME